jgi:hypothetical protein
MPLDAALFSAGITAFKVFMEFSLFLLSALVITDLIFVLSADLAAILRVRCFLFCRSRFSADLCVAKAILLNSLIWSRYLAQLFKAVKHKLGDHIFTPGASYKNKYGFFLMQRKGCFNYFKKILDIILFLHINEPLIFFKET